MGKNSTCYKVTTDGVKKPIWFMGDYKLVLAVLIAVAGHLVLLFGIARPVYQEPRFIGTSSVRASLINVSSSFMDGPQNHQTQDRQHLMERPLAEPEQEDKLGIADPHILPLGHNKNDYKNDTFVETAVSSATYLTTSDVDEPARAVEIAPLIYPEDAYLHKVAGTVTLRVYISEHGTVENVDVLHSAPPGIFELAAIEGVLNSRFSAARLAGRNVKVTKMVAVTFDPIRDIPQ
ncbi:MAG: hypothetical protein RLZZ591_1409 [Pseudomonadota bacterium]|jgi:TonB family protein